MVAVAAVVIGVTVAKAVVTNEAVWVLCMGD
jgi:hypothetical protein